MIPPGSVVGMLIKALLDKKFITHMQKPFKSYGQFRRSQAYLHDSMCVCLSVDLVVSYPINSNGWYCPHCGDRYCRLRTES